MAGTHYDCIGSIVPPQGMDDCLNKLDNSKAYLGFSLDSGTGDVLTHLDWFQSKLFCQGSSADHLHPLLPVPLQKPKVGGKPLDGGNWYSPITCFHVSLLLQLIDYALDHQRGG